MCGTNSSRAAFIRNYVKTKISLKKMFLCCFYAKNGISVSKWSCAFGQKYNSSSFTVRGRNIFRPRICMAALVHCYWQGKYEIFFCWYDQCMKLGFIVKVADSCAFTCASGGWLWYIISDTQWHTRGCIKFRVLLSIRVRWILTRFVTRKNGEP